MPGSALFEIIIMAILLIGPGIFLPVMPVMAQAGGTQTALSFASVEADLWPEYDQPSMLVIYHLILAPGTSLPASLTLHIPSTAGDPVNLAARQSDGKLYNVAFTRTVEGDFSRVDFTTPTLEIQFEYYDPGVKNSANPAAYPILKKGKTDRAYTFEWQGDYLVKNMHIQVQQPIGASQMVITPSLGAGVAGDAGLVYFNGQEGSVSSGTKFKLSLSYQKQDDSLSATALQVQPSSPITPQTAGRAFNLLDYLPWFLGAAGLLLAAGGIIWYRRSISEERRVFSRQKAGRIQENSKGSAASDPIYCHQCGKQAAASDLFCRSCGSNLRRD
jgi:hypothetical protein